MIIDEAGMADTLSLDAAVQFAIRRGASVRLVGDDQQLAAIGAGGVLRDIKNQHGALHLTELHRFTNPAEAQASLALREGLTTSLAFYLDHGRVHVGDLARTIQDAFAAWVSDRDAGLDAIMLASTRDLVAELNSRARQHHIGDAKQVAETRLADGNRASVGNIIITRTNDRRLRLSPTDWVKNGDRWTVTKVGRHGGLTVRRRLPCPTIQAHHDLATLVRDQAATADDLPAWAVPDSDLGASLLGEIAVWRAATGVDSHDSRPTARPQLETTLSSWQQHLDRDIAQAIVLRRNIAGPPRRAISGNPSPRRHDLLLLAARRGECLFLSRRAPVLDLPGSQGWIVAGSGLVRA